MNANDDIEYLGYNISTEGVLLEKKIYYFWNPQFSNLVIPQLIEVLSPFDYAIRQDNTLSISCFIKCDNSQNIKQVFKFIKNWTKPDYYKFVKEQFLSIHDPRNGVHYPSILSFKYKTSSLNKLSLYVGPLQKKSEMREYLHRIMDTFPMKHNQETVMIINDLVITQVCDIYLAAWDLDKNGCYVYKVYLKIKNHISMSEIINKRLKEIAAFLNVDGFKLSVIGFVFSKDTFDHYNLYYKPL